MRLHCKDASQQRRQTARKVQDHGIDKQQELQKRMAGTDMRERQQQGSKQQQQCTDTGYRD